MFSLICVWINGWVNNGAAGDLRRHRTHCDVTVMSELVCFTYVLLVYKQSHLPINPPLDFLSQRFMQSPFFFYFISYFFVLFHITFFLLFHIIFDFIYHVDAYTDLCHKIHRLWSTDIVYTYVVIVAAVFTMIVFCMLFIVGQCLS